MHFVSERIVPDGGCIADNRCDTCLVESAQRFRSDMPEPTQGQVDFSGSFNSFLYVVLSI
jgi:hypothetical protein